MLILSFFFFSFLLTVDYVNALLLNHEHFLEAIFVILVSCLFGHTESASSLFGVHAKD